MNSSLNPTSLRVTNLKKKKIGRIRGRNWIECRLATVRKEWDGSSKWTKSPIKNDQIRGFIFFSNRLLNKRKNGVAQEEESLVKNLRGKKTVVRICGARTKRRKKRGAEDVRHARTDCARIRSMMSCEVAAEAKEKELPAAAKADPSSTTSHAAVAAEEASSAMGPIPSTAEGEGAGGGGRGASRAEAEALQERERNSSGSSGGSGGRRSPAAAWREPLRGWWWWWWSPMRPAARAWGGGGGGVKCERQPSGSGLCSGGGGAASLAQWESHSLVLEWSGVEGEADKWGGAGLTRGKRGSGRWGGRIYRVTTTTSRLSFRPGLGVCGQLLRTWRSYKLLTFSLNF